MLSSKIRLDHISKHIKNSRFFMRVDFNAQLSDGKGQDPTRIQCAIPSIKKIISENCKSQLLGSHLSRPGGKKFYEFSMAPIVPKLEDFLGTQVQFLKVKIKNAEGEKVKVDKKLIEKFTSQLNSLSDLYANDSFGTAHRAHSSSVDSNNKIRATGYPLRKKLDYFYQCMDNLKRPFLVILGEKVKDTIQLIRNTIYKFDEMIVGFGLAFAFLKRMHNINIGEILFDEHGYKIVDDMVQIAYYKNVKNNLCFDFSSMDKGDKEAHTQLNDISSGIPDSQLGLDVGKKQKNQLNDKAVKGANVKQGDWFCSQCDEHNFAFRKCNEPKGLEMEMDKKEKGWTCFKCNTYNQSTNSECSNCGHQQSQGDKICQNCQKLNFKYRTQCYSCKEPLDQANNDNQKADIPNNKNEFKSGDWSCEGCGFQNFAKRFQCKKCGMDKQN